MSACLFVGGKDTGRLNNVLCSSGSPLDIFRVFFKRDSDGVSVHNELIPVQSDGSLELSMGGVVFDEVGHVVEGDEGVVDVSDLGGG